MFDRLELDTVGKWNGIKLRTAAARCRCEERGDTFTYVDDIVEGVVRVTDRVPTGDASWDGRQSGIGPSPARVYNIGNGAPVRLMDFIEALETELGVTAEKNLLPMQPGDVRATWSDCTALERDTGYRPGTDVRDGVRHVPTGTCRQSGNL